MICCAPGTAMYSTNMKANKRNTSLLFPLPFCPQLCIFFGNIHILTAPTAFVRISWPKTAFFRVDGVATCATPSLSHFHLLIDCVYTTFAFFAEGTSSAFPPQFRIWKQTGLQTHPTAIAQMLGRAPTADLARVKISSEVFRFLFGSAHSAPMAILTTSVFVLPWILFNLMLRKISTLFGLRADMTLKVSIANSTRALRSSKLFGILLVAAD